MGLLDLNKEQQRAFNRVKKAYRDAEKLGVLWVNQYGTMTAYNKEYIVGHGDDQVKPFGNPVDYREVIDRHGGNINVFETCAGMADDEVLWMLGLTDKGLDIHEND